MPQRKKIAIFGAGITGLIAARELIRAGHDVDVYEASDHVGGLASTFKDNDGFIYDNGPRFIFSTLAEKIGISDICEPVKYFEHLYVGGRYYLFPFGFIRNLRFSASAGIAMLTRVFHRTPQNLGEFLQTYYGRIFSGEVLKPLIEKWSGVSAAEMSVDFASRLLPTNIAYVIHSLIKKLRGGVTEDYYKKGRYIVYPKGSNSKIFEALMKTPGLRVHLNAPLEQLEKSNDRICQATVGGKKIAADYYVSTIPISKMVPLIDQAGAMQTWEQFRYRGILILFIKLKRVRVLDGLWTWFPEPKYKFYRVSEFKNALPELAPPDKTLISVEIACQEEDPFFKSTAKEVYAAVAQDLKNLYGLEESEIIGLDLKKSPSAYPVLKKSTENEQRALTHQTPFNNLFIAGRTGMFQYIMSEGCYESAMNCVNAVTAAMEGKDASVPSKRIQRDAYGRPDLIPE